MKTLIAIFCLFPLILFAQPIPAHAPDPDDLVVSRITIRKITSQMQKLIDANNAGITNLAQAKDTIAGQARATTVLTDQIKSLENWGDEGWTGKQKAETKLSKLEPKYHALKWPVCFTFAFLAAFAIVLVFLYFKVFDWAVTPIGAWVSLGTPTGVFAVVFTYFAWKL